MKATARIIPGTAARARRTAEIESTPTEHAPPWSTDAALVDACLAGEDAAWRELVERYGRLVYSIPLRFGMSTIEADDVFQNVFTIAFKQLYTLRRQASLTAWLITITHRETQRHGKFARTLDELDESIEDARMLPPDQVQRWERQHQVQMALRQLNPRSRALIQALFLESDRVNYREVARRLQVPLGSIGPTRARAFRKLERILSQMGVDSDL